MERIVTSYYTCIEDIPCASKYDNSLSTTEYITSERGIG